MVTGLPSGSMRTAVEHALLSVVRRGGAADSVQAITTAHIVECGLALMQRSPLLAKRGDKGECGIVCATYSYADQQTSVHAAIGAVEETAGPLVELALANPKPPRGSAIHRGLVASRRALSDLASAKGFLRILTREM